MVVREEDNQENTISNRRCGLGGVGESFVRTFKDKKRTKSEKNKCLVLRGSIF